MLYHIQTLPDWHHSYTLECLAQVDCAQVGLEHTCGQLHVDGCTCMCVRVRLKFRVQFTGTRSAASWLLSPRLWSSSILPPYLFHGALISAINKLAHLINCCYVSSFYCIMRDYQTTWCHIPKKSSHHCGNLVSHFNIVAYGKVCLIKQSCFQNVSCSVVLLPGYPSTATCSTLLWD
jgi:hypothetical protein